MNSVLRREDNQSDENEGDRDDQVAFPPRSDPRRGEFGCLRGTGACRHYLRGFTLPAGVPMELLKVQWEFVCKALADGVIQGYSILGGLHIDLHPDQATWVRDFIRAN